MEIYKLSDEIISSCKKNRDNTKSIITNLKPAVKNKERVNIFVNGVFAFSLDIAQVVEFKIKVGQEISEERLAELKKASEFGKLYQRTLEWVLIRPRSIRETRDYLMRKLKISFSGRSSRLSSQGSSLRPRSNCGCSSEDIFELSENIISRLKNKNYLDDLKFAEYYVENRFVKKGVSRRRLEMELMKKGISREIIEEVLAESGRDEKEEILKIIEKKRTKYDDEKLIQYLCRQGFSYELARNLVETHGRDSQNLG